MRRVGVTYPRNSGFLRKGIAKDLSSAAFLAPSKINFDTPGTPSPSSLRSSRQWQALPIRAQRIHAYPKRADIMKRDVAKT